VGPMDAVSVWAGTMATAAHWCFWKLAHEPEALPSSAGFHLQGVERTPGLCLLPRTPPYPGPFSGTSLS
jgi:hypothetical protein